jgi:hypothetical protein
MATQQVMPVQCPSCGIQFTAPVENIINGQDMSMKAAFLQGHINATQCPQCGIVFAPLLPLLYYDLEKELSLVLFPPNLNVTGAAQEKIIGDLTNKLVNSLPTEQRKFYLFNPKQFLSRESMVKAILEADGISEEELATQTAKAKLIEEFLKAPDEATLRQKVTDHDAELDLEFFEILTAYMQMAQMSGDQARFQTFLALRTILADLSTQGKKIVKEIDAKLGLVILKNQDELLERLQNAQNDEEREALVSAGHPLLDYGFFQKLTAKIDQAAKSGDTKTAQQLKSLRTVVLSLKEKHEQQVQAALEKAANLLKEVLQSGQPDKVLEKKLDQIDEAFFYILNANIEEARRQGQNQAVQALETLGNITMAMLQEKYGPEEEDKEENEPAPQSEILIGKR